MARCGTIAGNNAHSDAGEPACAACLAARREYEAARKGTGPRAIPPPVTGDEVDVDEPTDLRVGRWAAYAACHDKPAAWFFPDSPETITPQAKALCDHCPVQPDCLNHAVRIGEPYGTWGGRSEAQLARLRITLRTSNRGRTA